MKEKDFIIDRDVWVTPPIRPDGFLFQVQVNSPIDGLPILKKSIDDLEMGEYVSHYPPHKGAEEWDYAFTHLDGLDGGLGEIIHSGNATPPKDRAQALEVIREFLMRQYIKELKHPWDSMNGHYPWHHYAAEFGFDFLGTEIGENVNSYQWHIAVNRGAAKQYHKPWLIDFSAWHWDSITDYSSNKVWGETGGPDYGHSISLLERTYFMSYMAGANAIRAEAGAYISFYDEVDENGCYKVTPYGEAGKKLYDFSRSYPDVGVCYTPFGIVLDYYHGIYPGFEGKKAFNYFPYNDGDEMTWELINSFYPNGWEVIGNKEVGTLVNGPFGDTFDILLQNASQTVLNSYPCLILSGDIKLSDDEARRYAEYVNKGGTLLLNSAYLAYFPHYRMVFNDEKRYEITGGKGKVIVYGDDYKVDVLRSIIKEQLDILMPFKLSANIQHIVNVKDGSLYITLINNDGVSKEPKSKPVFDYSKAMDIAVRYVGHEEVHSVRDIKNNKDESISDNCVHLHIGAGEIAIVEFKF